MEIDDNIGQLLILFAKVREQQEEIQELMDQIEELLND